MNYETVTMIRQQLSFLLLFTFLGFCIGQKTFQTTTEWWNDYKNKIDNAYTAINSLVVDRWDTNRQAKKAAALAHLNSLQQIDDSCMQQGIEQQPNQGPAIACARDQDQRFCEFGWAYNPLGTRQQICSLQSTPHRGNCCIITFPGTIGAGGAGGR